MGHGFDSLSPFCSGLIQACASWFLERGIKREAGFTEQRLPSAPCSGRITGLIHSEPPWLNELTQLYHHFFPPLYLSVVLLP
ncbi:hypothetical protein ES332_A03G032000v1 [Gossypium tomentosum]|uniref:Uncharacterized protein n=1 Tax=Gossypium tomentosum TaxID=34277 RepID=A0A5D2R1L2_GOSTO|nr:hypothetical protein ES332_A03G032000v1 [Gossypium tomentosum]